jgi:hypothetical protein
LGDVCFDPYFILSVSPRKRQQTDFDHVVDIVYLLLTVHDVPQISVLVFGGGKFKYDIFDTF